jgi:hypothetical protein
MTTATAGLERECHAFTRLLTGRPPTAYVTRKYIDAHRARPDLTIVMGFERVILAHAARGPLVARLADAYARRLFPRGSLRKKLVLLLAIIETSPGLHRDVDAAPVRSPFSAIVSLAVTGTAGIALAFLGLALFSVVRLVSGGDRQP